MEIIRFENNTPKSETVILKRTVELLEYVFDGTVAINNDAPQTDNTKSAAY